MKKRLKILFFVLVGIVLISAIAVIGINAFVKLTAENSIVSAETALSFEDADCILVLGCSVKNNKTPSDMLEDRLLTGIALYENGAAPKLLMSGDHGQEDYNEVSVMKEFAEEKGVESQDIFMDHAGFSTYESIYRAKEIFGADKMIVVTQEYHLYRALFICEYLGVDAVGVSADIRSYAGQEIRDLREILARVKDFFTSIIKPEPTYLGDAISINGNGDATND